MRSAAARVRKGAAYLDRAHPGWAQAVDTEVLDLTSNNRCVLGQLEGSYSCYVYRRNLDSKWAVQHGFLVPHGVRPPWYLFWREIRWTGREDLRELRGEWVKIIDSRRAATVPAQ